MDADPGNNFFGVKTPNGQVHLVDLNSPTALQCLQQLGVKVDSVDEFKLAITPPEPAVNQSIQPLSQPPSPLSSFSPSPKPAPLTSHEVAVTPPPALPINTWGEEKPPLSFPGLVARVLDDLPHQCGTLHDIYTHIIGNFPYFAKSKSKGWQKSIASSLSGHAGNSKRLGRLGQAWAGLGRIKTII